MSSSTDLYSYDQDSQSADGSAVYNNGYTGNQMYQGAGDSATGFPQLPQQQPMMLKSEQDLTLDTLIKRLKDR